MLGPLWITLATAFFIGVMGYLWSALLNRDAQVFVPWFTIGISLWRFIAAVINGGAATFVKASAIIQSIPMPLSVHVYRIITNHLIIFAHNFAIIISVLFIFSVPVNFQTLLFFPGILIITATAVVVSMLLGLIGARYRDFPHTVTMIMTPAFFFTPVLWMPDMLKGSDRAGFALLNPFTHFLAVVREPLLGRVPTGLNYGVTIGILAVLILISLQLLSRKKTSVPYWV